MTLKFRSTFVLIVLLLVTNLAAAAGTFTVFGPHIYSRQTGRSVTVTSNFAVFNPNTQYTLHVQNSGVASAEISINGIQILGPRDFDPHVATLDRNIGLQLNNQIQVQLRGKPDSNLMITISGVDNDPPSISASASPGADTFGWNNSNVVVTFACSDQTSGISMCPGPVTVQTEGANQVVRGTAIDQAGNTSSASVTINIDRAAPMIVPSSSPSANSAGWTNTATTVSFQCSDLLSGIASCTSPLTISTQGANQLVNGTAVDKAGNTNTVSASINLDTTPPVLNIASPTEGSTVLAPTVTLRGSVTDALSGIASVTCNGVTAQISGGDLTCGLTLSRGLNPIAVTATDVAGNTATATIHITFSPVPLKILVSSGEIDASTEQFTDTAELYDPSTGEWTLTGNRIPNSPPASGFGFCGANMVLLGNGKVLFSGGGCSDTGVTTEGASLYDPSTNLWTPTAGMTFGRDQFAMLRLNNGNAIVVDGCAGGCIGPNRLSQFLFQVGQSTEIYDQTTNSWSIAGSTNTIRGNLAVGNFLQASATLLDGKVLLCSGSNGVTVTFSSCELYDPTEDRWSPTGDMGDSGIRQFVVLSNGKVLMERLDNLNTQLWDENTGTWTLTGSLHTPHFRGSAALLSSGEVLLSGGTDGANPVQTAEIYDPISGVWRTTAPMSVAREGHIAIRLADGRVMVAGGFGPGFVALSSAEIFDPASGTWSDTGSLSQARAFANAVAISF